MSAAQKDADPGAEPRTDGPRIRWDAIRAYAQRFEEYDIIAQTDAASRGREQTVEATDSESQARFGPVAAGAEVSDGWRVAALRVTTAGLQVTLDGGDAGRVTFDVDGPGSSGPDGPFDSHPLRVTYQRTEAPYERFADAGQALCDLLRQAPGEGELGWHDWMGDAQSARGPSRTRALPDADALDVRADGKIYLRITDSCQERCKFCFFYDTDEVDNLVRHHDIDELVDSLSAEGISQVIVTGGEPTLHPRLVQYVAALHGKGFAQIIVQTNGIGFADGTLLETLVPYRDRLGLGFSLHSATAATNDVLTTVSRGYFEQKVEAVERALALGFHCKVTLVLSRHNLGELVPFIELCHRLRAAGEFFVQLSLPSFQGRMLAFLDTYPRLAELTKALPPALARARELDLRVALCHQCQVPPCIIPEDVQHLESLWFCETPEMWSKGDRAYGAQCGECSMRPWCSGVWTGYAEAFGTDELRPFAAGDVERPT